MALHSTRRQFLLTTSALGATTGCLGTSGSTETATGESPSTTESTSCRKTPTTKGTAIYEAAPPDLSIENTTTADQTVSITVTRLPDDVTARPPDNAPHPILDLSEQPTVFAKTIELSAGVSRVFRCTGMTDSSNELQIAIDVQNGPAGSFDWRQAMGPLNIDLKDSSVKFSLGVYQ